MNISVWEDMQKGSVKKKLPVLLLFPLPFFFSRWQKALPFTVERQDDHTPWPAQSPIMLLFHGTQTIFQAILLGM